MVGSDFCELPDLCDALINHTLPASDGPTLRSRQCQFYCSLIWNFIKTWFPFFSFSQPPFLQLIKHRVYTDSFTSLQIWSGFIVYCPGLSAIEHTGLKSHKRRRGAFIYKFLRNYNSEWWSQDAQPSSHPTGHWVPGIINRVMMDNKISIRRILCLICAKDPSLA